MTDEKKKREQRISMKPLVKLGKCATKSFRLLTDEYGDAVISRSHCFERLERFVGGPNEDGHRCRVVRATQKLTIAIRK